ncbi:MULTISPECIES: autoinducer binding domain-containing protein [Mesorhizobium]|uniref:autoinducer binding domain-containing protein n=1 Tax=Mesorhizobium TaxID=68287 RepID=UPI001FCF05ED|nr:MULTISPECIES: autoinducer binding domain-containing protein [Mesorhizobium]
MSEDFPCATTMYLPKTAKERARFEFCRYIDQTRAVDNPQEIFDLLAAFAQKVNFPWIAYQPFISGQESLNPIGREPTTMLNYPNEWQKRYFDMGYYKIDPIIKKIRQRFGAIQWKDVYDDANTTEAEQRIFDEAAMFGLRAGVIVPLHGPNGKLAMMSFAQSSRYNVPTRLITYLELSALKFRLAIDTCEASRQVYREEPYLSAREKECVFWVSKGKSSMDI